MLLQGNALLGGQGLVKFGIARVEGCPWNVLTHKDRGHGQRGRSSVASLGHTVCGLCYGVDSRKVRARLMAKVQTFLFLGAFAKFRKATIRFVMFVCPSVHPSVRPHGTTRLPLGGFS